MFVYLIQTLLLTSVFCRATADRPVPRKLLVSKLSMVTPFHSAPPLHHHQVQPAATTVVIHLPISHLHHLPTLQPQQVAPHALVQPLLALQHLPLAVIHMHLPVRLAIVTGLLRMQRRDMHLLYVSVFMPFRKMCFCIVLL